MVKFEEVVTIKRTNCAKCLTFLYTIPCKVDENIVKYLEEFGQPLYAVKSLRLIRIDSKDGYKIDSKVGKNLIKFAIPKNLDGTNLNATSKKLKFEIALATWLAKKLDIPITIGEQEITND